MKTIPALDDKTGKLNEWTLQYLKLAGKEATRQNVNQASVALNEDLKKVRTEDEAALVKLAAEYTQTLDMWQSAWRLLTRHSIAAWEREYQRLYALNWWHGIRLQAKRMGW